MKIVIDIPDNEYHQICELRLHNRTFYDDAIRNGTPLPKGHWTYYQKDNGDWVNICSVCGQDSGVGYSYDYCPNCGADMRGEAE